MLKVNGRPVLEGSLRIHWAVKNIIHLKEDDDQRIKNRILKDTDVPLMVISLILISIQSHAFLLNKFQKLQSKYVTDNSKNGQHQNGNGSISKFDTLPNNLNQNDVEDELDEPLKVI